MKLPDITKIIIIFAISVLVFFLGYSVRGRDIFNKSDDKVVGIGANGSRVNSLTDLKTLDILGFTSDKVFAKFGTFYFNVLPNKDTEVLFVFNDSPAIYKQSGGATTDIPDNLSIKLATTNIAGDDYSYDLVGSIQFESNPNGTRNGRFPGVLAPKNKVPALTNVNQIVFRSPNSDQQNIFLDDSANIPPQVRKGPAPYFFVNMK
jgi:hypothetical protein